MNVWRRGPLTENPYERTAFGVAQIPREVVRYRTLVQMIGQTKRLTSVNAKLHVLHGRPVTEAEINAAAQVLLDPKRRILEELLCHATERPSQNRCRNLAQEASAALSGPSSEPLTVSNLRGLESWVEDIVGDFFKARPSPDPSFGALELEIVPPFGGSREE